MLSGRIRLPGGGSEFIGAAYIEYVEYVAMILRPEEEAWKILVFRILFNDFKWMNSRASSGST
jgi:hypothetical protein